MSLTRATAISVCVAIAALGYAFAAPAAGLDEIQQQQLIMGATRHAPPGTGPAPPAYILSRSVITGKIAHYSFKVRFGPGKYDVIGMHRIVKESVPFRPVRADEAMLLLHGDVLGFEGVWLANLKSPGMPVDHAFPVYLAQNGIDVWGIDQGWTLVPADETDSSWAVGWGFDKELRGLNTAIHVARTIRAATGSGHGPIFALGFSRGAQVVLVHAGQQARLPGALRSIKGYAYGDAMFKFTDPAMKQAACDFYDEESGRIAAGDVIDTAGALFALLGELARTSPDDPSPVFEGMTNYTAALVLGAVPFGYPYGPNYHLVAGVYGTDGLPIGLQYTDVPLFFDWLTGAPPYEPVQIPADGDAIGCEREDVPWDDGFADITAPILYIEAAGGAGGDTGRQTLAFLPQADITELIIQLHPEEERWLDFAHVDMWLAGNAQELLWRPTLEWIRANR